LVELLEETQRHLTITYEYCQVLSEGLYSMRSQEKAGMDPALLFFESGSVGSLPHPVAGRLVAAHPDLLA
jgi:hypothetical protein